MTKQTFSNHFRVLKMYEYDFSRIEYDFRVLKMYEYDFSRIEYDLEEKL